MLAVLLSNPVCSPCLGAVVGEAAALTALHCPGLSAALPCRAACPCCFLIPETVKRKFSLQRSAYHAYLLDVVPPFSPVPPRLAFEIYQSNGLKGVSSLHSFSFKFGEIFLKTQLRQV